MFVSSSAIAYSNKVESSWWRIISTKCRTNWPSKVERISS